MRLRLLVALVLALGATGCGAHREAPKPRLVRVPNVTGLPETAAVRLLADAGLCLRRITGTEQSGPSIVELARKPYTVVTQSLRPGRIVRLHREIELVAVRPGGADEADEYVGCPNAVAWVHRASVKLDEGSGGLSVSSAGSKP
jgi:hypothetical protein